MRCPENFLGRYSCRLKDQEDKVFRYILLVKIKLLIKKLEDSEVMIVTTVGSSYNCWLELLLMLKIEVITTASVILVLPVQNVTIARRVSAVILSPVTTDIKDQKKNDVNARSMLPMALPDEHLIIFNQYKDAKTLFAAIQRFDGNEATKKTQKTLL
ncbi:hypothetical protein Tco_1488236 [Tanacetum coccineum]